MLTKKTSENRDHRLCPPDREVIIVKLVNLTGTCVEPVAIRRQLRVMTAVHVGELDDLNKGTVLRCIARCRSHYLRSGARVELVAWVEFLARARLVSRTEPRFGREYNLSLA